MSTPEPPQPPWEWWRADLVGAYSTPPGASVARTTVMVIVPREAERSESEYQYGLCSDALGSCRAGVDLRTRVLIGDHRAWSRPVGFQCSRTAMFKIGKIGRKHVIARPHLRPGDSSLRYVDALSVRFANIYPCRGIRSQTYCCVYALTRSRKVVYTYTYEVALAFQCVIVLMHQYLNATTQ